MSVMRGTVTQIDADGRPLVEVPDLGAGYSFGPLDVGVPGALAVGRRVLVSPVSGIIDDLVVVGILQ